MHRPADTHSAAAIRRWRGPGKGCPIRLFRQREIGVHHGHCFGIGLFTGFAQAQGNAYQRRMRAQPRQVGHHHFHVLEVQRKGKRLCAGRTGLSGLTQHVT